MAGERLDERLEMLVVARWLDEGAPASGALTLPVAEAASELGLEPNREGLLAVMGALGSLEERGLVRVAWPGGAAEAEARIELDPELRADAERLFGRPER